MTSERDRLLNIAHRCAMAWQDIRRHYWHTSDEGIWAADIWLDIRRAVLALAAEG